MATRPVHTVYFTKLVLENIRCFSDSQELDLTNSDGCPARWTLLVGDNGVGKTTLLQCLARMRPEFNPETDSARPLGPGLVEPELAAEEDNDELGEFARSTGNTTASLTAQLSYGARLDGRRASRRGNISTWIRIARSAGALVDFDHGGDFTQGPPLTNVQEPFVIAYGAGRHPKTTDAGQSIDSDPVKSLFTVEASLHDAEALLYRLEYRSFKGSKRARTHLIRLKKALVSMLPEVNHIRDIKIFGPKISDSFRGPTGVHVVMPYGTVPLRQLSLGYQTVFAWGVDLALRLIDRYPNTPFPLAKPAIVLVDEIDLHLHPHWQRNIRRRLTHHFPNVQFIATAHSPLMAQTSLRSNLAVLRRVGDHVAILNDPAVVAGWRLDQVVTSDLFGLASPRSPEVAQFLDRRRALLQQKELSSGERQELIELDRKASELPTAESATDQDAMDIIRRAAAALGPPR